MPCLVHRKSSVFFLEVTNGHLVTFAAVSHCKTFVHSDGKSEKATSFCSFMLKIPFLTKRRYIHQSWTSSRRLADGGSRSCIPSTSPAWRGRVDSSYITPSKLPEVTTTSRIAPKVNKEKNPLMTRSTLIAAARGI